MGPVGFAMLAAKLLEYNSNTKSNKQNFGIIGANLSDK